MSRLILTYHAVETGAPPLFTPPELFESHVRALHESGYISVTVKALVDGFNAPEPLRQVAITFDDGYQSVLTNALPVLQKYAFTATVFIISQQRTNKWRGQPNSVPQRDLLDWDEIRMLHDQGCEIGSHTRTHPALTHIPLSDAEHEIERSQDEIEQRTGVKPTTFCYPYGAMNDAVKADVARHYQCAVGTRLALLGANEDRYALPRLDSYYINPDLIRRLESIPARLYIRGRAALRTVKRIAQPDWGK